MISQDFYKITRFDGNTDGLDKDRPSRPPVMGNYVVSSVFFDVSKMGVMLASDYTILANYTVTKKESFGWCESYYIKLENGIEERMTLNSRLEPKYILYKK